MTTLGISSSALPTALWTPASVFSSMAKLASACSVETDRDVHVAGDPAVARFSNRTEQTIYLDGCFPFCFEKLDEGDWVDGGAPLMCIWEGFAQPVAPGERIVTPFGAPGEPGTWRLSYPVGMQCDPGQPLRAEHCGFTTSVPSPSFSVLV